jgi:hypothetical protein
MLDFLREQDNKGNQGNVEDLSESQQSSLPGEPDVQKEKQSAGDGYLAVSAEGKKAHKSTILLLVLVCLGLAAVLFMIKKGVPQAAIAQSSDDEQAQIDKLIERLGGVRSEMSDRVDQIIKKFYEFSNARQVSADQLVRNPFKSTRLLGGLQGEYLRLPRGRSGSMQLLSIMRTGENGEKICCMIDDKILYVGDTIGEFKVTKIADNSVELSSSEGKLILKLVNDN